jgi:SAM-dependent methyltransferase
MTVHAISPAEVARSLGRHVPLYRRRPPHYQAVMLNALRQIWRGRAERLLDVGGGTGVIGQAIQELFPVGTVQAIDIEDRFLPDLSIATATYDGTHIPFPDGAFDAATINNVLHHVAPEARVPLMREIRRAVAGPVYIKDHLSTGAVDDVRLALLDFMGNVPFHGMVKACYLRQAEWEQLAGACGYRIAETATDRYRSGLFASAFPNRLETAMRWEPAA